MTCGEDEAHEHLRARRRPRRRSCSAGPSRSTGSRTATPLPPSPARPTSSRPRPRRRRRSRETARAPHRRRRARRRALTAIRRLTDPVPGNTEPAWFRRASPTSRRGGTGAPPRRVRCSSWPPTSAGTIWLVTQVVDDRQVVLLAHPAGQPVRPGHGACRGRRSFCRQMIEGNAPRLATVTAAVPAYASPVDRPARRRRTRTWASRWSRADGTRVRHRCAGVAFRAKPRSAAREMTVVEAAARMLSTLMAAGMAPPPDAACAAPSVTQPAYALNRQRGVGGRRDVVADGRIRCRMVGPTVQRRAARRRHRPASPRERSPGRCLPIDRRRGGQPMTRSSRPSRRIRDRRRRPHRGHGRGPRLRREPGPVHSDLHVESGHLPAGTRHPPRSTPCSTPPRADHADRTGGHDAAGRHRDARPGAGALRRRARRAPPVPRRSSEARLHAIRLTGREPPDGGLRGRRPTPPRRR